MPPTGKALSPALRHTRRLLVAGYLGLIGFGLLSELQPRVFWTMLLPLLPVGVVLMGYHVWRTVCPLAWFGDLGRRVRRGRQRRVPAWLEAWFFPVTFAVLLAMLVLRLVATNGDPLWLSGLLAALALAAFLTNSVYTGKTWCHFLCPVGFVERVYAEPRSLRVTANSQCTPCTACKLHCPDIDQENAYWKDVTGAGRRLAIYAFPGLVLAFYTYYWLRHGDWEAYFDGRWTRKPVDAALVLGQGFFFAPAVPALLAATLTLVAFSAGSYGLFVLLERAVRGVTTNDERGRHLTLALAAFAAFNLFYLFAGAPSLRHLSGGTRAVAFAAPLVATLFLVKRWQRTPEHFIGERGAVRLLRSWPFDEKPPRDPGEVYGWIRASRHAREQNVTAYANTVRGMIADGLVRRGELRLLEGLRQQLGISQPEHEQVLARLTEEERQLFEDGAGAGIESRAQLEGYEVALAEAVLRGAPAEEIDELRLSFGVSPFDHEAVQARVRGASGELLSRARRQLERARRLRLDLATLGATEPTESRVFLCYLLGRSRDEAALRVLEVLEAAGDGPVIQSLRPRLLEGDAAERAGALEVLALACPGAEALVPELEPLLAGRSPAAAEIAGETEARTLARLLQEPNPYLRAAAVWAAAGHADPALADAVARAREDGHHLVRETAAHFSAGASAGAPGERRDPGSGLASIEIMSYLHAAPFFSDLDPDDLCDIAQLAVEQTIDPPAAICEAGDSDADALFVILAGRATVLGRSASGAEGPPRTIATLGRGELVGELGVLDGSPRSSTVRPEGGPVRVLRIPGARLRSLLLNRPRAAQALLGILAGRIRRLVEAPR
jgi:hypothetical protein